jgi:hypothetical protein
MKSRALAGVFVLSGGYFFFVPTPHSEPHGINVGDAHVGITTEPEQKFPPAVRFILVVAGAGLMISGRKA